MAAEDSESLYKYVELPNKCAGCRSSYLYVHLFYKDLCPACADLNFKQRFRSVDLKGRNVVLLGGRLKAGYAIALKVLRAGAKLTLTTRFPAQALASFKQEKDYGNWSENLLVYGLDIRRVKDIKEFAWFYGGRFRSLDILINNVSQNAKPSDTYYTTMVQKEQALMETEKLSRNYFVSNKSLNNKELLAAFLDMEDLEPSWWSRLINGSPKDSSSLNLEDIGSAALLEISLINQISPCLLAQLLEPLFNNSRFANKFIVNATSSDAQFSGANIDTYSPHTTMSKAALNRWTLTAAQKYRGHGILVNSVDIGWLSTPGSDANRPPWLDAIDGAARMLYPIFESLEGGQKLTGKLLKDYRIEDW